jgi:predicted nucleic acid-binding protein
VKAACCDTSFLFALYGEDIHTPRALHDLQSIGQPLTLSALNVYELENALRFAAWRKRLSKEDAADCTVSFKADLEAGRFGITSGDFSQILATARQLSAAHTLSGGHRALDILHVAAAIHLKAGVFLSFDTNQRKLAAKEGLKLNN